MFFLSLMCLRTFSHSLIFFRIFFRALMSYRILRQIAISRRSDIASTGRVSNIDAPQEQTLLRINLRKLFVIFQNRFFRSSLDDKNINCAFLSTASSGHVAEFSTCRGSKLLLLPLLNRRALCFRLKSTLNAAYLLYLTTELFVAFKIFVEGSAANVRREAKSSTLTREETSSLLRFPANKKVFLSMVDKAFK